MSGFTDIPKEHILDDEFKIGKYIRGLSRFIENCDTPMTVAIQGDWGSGKTSVMNMVRRELNRSIIPVWFNAWKYAQFDMGEQLTISLIVNLIDALSDKLPPEDAIDIQKTKSSLKKYFFKGLAITAELMGSGKGADYLEEMGKEKEDNIELISSLKEKFQVYIDKVTAAKKDSRVVFFVDDLDRLQPTRAVELLEALKLFLDCRGCVFVLAIDYEVVSRGISQKFGIDDNEKSRSFFDKIIQVPFKMPVAQYDLGAYVQKILAELHIEASKEERQSYLDLIRHSVGYNPRSMKRLFNVYTLLDLIQQKETEGWHRGMLFAVLCMQLAHEDVYSFLAEQSDSITEELLCYLRDIDEKGDEQKDLAAFVAKEGPGEKYIISAHNFLEDFIDFVKPAVPENLERLQEVLGLSAVTATGGGRKLTNGASGKGVRYEKYMDEAFSRISIAEPIEKTNGKDGWNGADFKFYLLLNHPPVSIKNGNDLMQKVLEELFALYPDRFYKVMAQPEQYDKLQQLFRGGKSGGKGFIAPKSTTFGTMETSSNYNDKIRQLRSVLSALGLSPSDLVLEIKLAHRKESK